MDEPPLDYPASRIIWNDLVMLIGCAQPPMEAFKAAEKAIEGARAAEAVD